VRLLEFSGAAAWADAIAKETDRDAGKVRLAGRKLTLTQATKSAAVVARTIATDRMAALDGHAFAEIQTWRDSDEMLAAKLRPSAATRIGLPSDYAGGTCAAHVVAAAVMAALEKDAAIPAIFERMLSVLKVMHDANPSWGPLYIVHPGNVARSFAFDVGGTTREA
jgi:hypothetical protein